MNDTKELIDNWWMLKNIKWTNEIRPTFTLNGNKIYRGNNAKTIKGH